jgi:hypothetical protein
MEGRAMKKITLLLALMTMAASAQAYTISAKVGPLLKQAQALIAAKNYQGAMAKVNEAEAVKSYPDDATVINEYRTAIEISSLGPGAATCTTPGMVTRCDGRRVQP